MYALIAFTIFAASTSSFAQQQRPFRLPVTAYNGSCPATNQERNVVKENIRSILQESFPDVFSSMPQCACGGSGTWTKVASLDLSDLTQQCPPQWNLISTPVRGCVKSSSAGRTCDSATFSAKGVTYSRVCGRVTGIQNGGPTAFSLTNAQTTIEESYLDGVSITHGNAGSRLHIWSFAAANYEMAAGYLPYLSCACTNTLRSWPITLPSFLENNYFCATGNPGPGFSSLAFSDDPLWDGEGCGPTNACCEFNTPPWFCVALPEPTSDDIELRICSNDSRHPNETIVTLIDVSVM